MIMKNPAANTEKVPNKSNAVLNISCIFSRALSSFRAFRVQIFSNGACFAQNIRGFSARGRVLPCITAWISTANSTFFAR